MIQGLSKTESNYRELMLDSSSSLKDFSLDRKKYYRKYIMNEYVEEKDSQAIKMGKLVETLLLEDHLFDKKFYMSACAKAPTNLMLAFVEALVTATVEAMNEQGIITKTFEEITNTAYLASGFKIAYETVINKFVDSDAQIYFDELIKVRTNRLIVVTIEDVTLAQRIADGIKANFVTKAIFTLINSKRWTVYDQLQVENYKLKNHRFKSMMDKVIVDHELKTVQVYDLKCVWSVENFYEEYYLYRRAYIQALLYWVAAQHFRNTVEECAGYRVLPPKFVVCDSTNYLNPLIYEISQEDLQDALQGFEYKGRTYPGVEEIIDDLQWAMEHNIWNMSRENHLNNGIVKIKK